jgi:hypothetical protein
MDNSALVRPLHRITSLQGKVKINYRREYMTQFDVRLLAPAPNDDFEFDNFCTQFAESLVNADYRQELYWHGRLIGPNQDGSVRLPRFMIDFAGLPRIFENEWRRRLEKHKIVITKFELIGPPVYRPDPNSPPGNGNAQIATCRAIIEGSIDGTPIAVGRVFDVRHLIRRSYHSYQTIIQ